MVVSLYAMLGFNLKDVKKHWGEKNNPLFAEYYREYCSFRYFMGSTSIDTVYCLMFFCIEKLLCVTCHLC